MDTKTCTKCRETKPLDVFSKCKAKKDGLQQWCKACLCAVAAARYAANPEKAKAKQVAWRAANPEKVKASQVGRYARNPEKDKALGAARYAANPEKAKARQVAWRAANPEKVKALDAVWRARNPEKVKARQVAYCDELRPAYVANALRIPVTQVTPELLELKRLQLTIHRGLKAATKRKTP